MTQTRFYRVRLNPEELSSSYAKERVMALNNARNNSYDLNSFRTNYNISKRFKNEYNRNNKIIHSVSNLENILKINNTYSNKNLELNNKVYNDILYTNHINNKRLNTYRTTCSLRKGTSYNNLKQLFNNRNNFCRNSNNNTLINYLRNDDENKTNNNLANHRSYKFISPIDNASLEGYNINNNSMNYNGGYICKNCLKNRLMKFSPNYE